MSRIFDALHEAARRRGQDTDTVDGVWEGLGIKQANMPVPEAERGNGQRISARSLAIDREIEDSPALPSQSPILEAVPAPDAADWAPSKITFDKQARLIPHTADPIVLERYRMLRNKILLEREKRFFRSLVITSASPREGKTVTVINLGLIFAALSSLKVLVVDGDMRRGTLGTWMGIDPKHPGLTNLLDGSARMEDALIHVEDAPLYILPRGNSQIGDVQLSRFDACFKPLTKHFDLILVDTPPVNVISDVQTIATSCDAVLLVARAFATTTKSLEQAVEKLQSYRMIGSVLNAGTPLQSRKYQGYY